MTNPGIDAIHGAIDRLAELNDGFASNLATFLDGVNRFEATVGHLGAIAGSLRLAPLPAMPRPDAIDLDEPTTNHAEPGGHAA